MTWPLWGGAFTLDGPVQLRAALAASGSKAAGLVFGARQDPDASATDETVAVELAWDGGWKLRELSGGAVGRSVSLDSRRTPARTCTCHRAQRSR